MSRLRQSAGRELLDATALELQLPQHRSGTREAGGLVWIPLESIRGSLRQTRRGPSPAADIQRLMRSIERGGVLQEPRVRPVENDQYEIVYGHSRIEALRRLMAEGKGAKAIRRIDGRASVLVKVSAQLNDDDAWLATIEENLTRTDLSAWEEVELVRAVDCSLREHGEVSSVRSLTIWLKEHSGEEHGRGWAETRLFVSRALTPEVLVLAGLLPDGVHDTGAADHSRLNQLSITALRGIAELQDVDRRAAALARAAGTNKPAHAGRRHRRGNSAAGRASDGAGRAANRPYGLAVRVRDVRRLLPLQAAELVEVVTDRLESLLLTQRASGNAECHRRMAIAVRRLASVIVNDTSTEVP